MTFEFLCLLLCCGTIDAQPGIDEIIGSAQRAAKIAPAAVCDDDTFLRRVTLDLAGRIPTERELQSFRKDPNRSEAIDRLLEDPGFPRFWSELWTAAAVGYGNPYGVDREVLRAWFESVLAREVPYDAIVKELLTAEGISAVDGPVNFLLRYPEEPATKVCRLFLGVRLECARCHDHPFDRWKREQFHQMAAFFAPGKYYMPDQDDPSKKHLVKARFLLGEEPPDPVANNPDARRVAVAAYLVYNPDNYWFARAFVNRIWNELLGDGFYAVDSLGPDAEVIHKLLVNRIAAVFRYRQFDIKWLFRLIMNTEAYQRDIRTLESEDEYFTAVRPVRLQGPTIVANLSQFSNVPKPVEREIQSAFRFDPSVPQRDLEGSIQQALLMMNQPALQNSLRNSSLKKRLLQIGDPRKRIEET